MLYEMHDFLLDRSCKRKRNPIGYIHKFTDVRNKSYCWFIEITIHAQ